MTITLDSQDYIAVGTDDYSPTIACKNDETQFGDLFHVYVPSPH
jgi:hypothetical protein